MMFHLITDAASLFSCFLPYPASDVVSHPVPRRFKWKSAQL